MTALTFPRNNAAPAIHLVSLSGLTDVTTLSLGREGWTVKPIRPPATFSSGERVLWSTMELLAQGDIPTDVDIDRARATLDDGNLTVYLAAVDMAAQPQVPCRAPMIGLPS